MSIAASAPVGGIVAELGGKSHPLLLRNAEIERFEQQYAPLGVFDLLDQFIGRTTQPQARHVRDLVALGLVGAGMPDRAADDLVSALPVHENYALREVAQTLLLVAFVPPQDAQKKSGEEDGSSSDQAVKTDAGTSPKGSGTSRRRASSRKKSNA